MNRRRFVRRAGSVLGFPFLAARRPARAGEPLAAAPARRIRPGDPAWPSAADWERLDRLVGGRLVAPRSPLGACLAMPGGSACQDVARRVRNPFFLGSEAALTQNSGWADAWSAAPSAYAVAARGTGDVVAAVNFARENNLRLVVKGGGHSYAGNSNAPDSLLIWTRPIDAVALHDSFVAEGCGAHEAALPAASVGAGATWMQAYDAVVTRGGRYVQGGGCTTVGVAGLVGGGGFGSFSKRYGLSAASLLQAEIVTADGAVRTANACTNPDLFWTLKGGGGGFGVVTRLTLRTHELPEFFGAAFGTIRAASDAAFRRLVARFVALYAERLFNPHWGETATFRPDNTFSVSMVFQDLDRMDAESAWAPFLGWVNGSPQDFTVAVPLQFLAAPARQLWNAAWLKRNAPGLAIADDRPGAPAENVFWAGDARQAGQFIHGYDSVWLPSSLLDHGRRPLLCDALVAGTRRWPIALHFNKGLAGAPRDAIAAARDTATHPSVLDAFALAISGAQGPPAFPGLPGPPPDLPKARRQAADVAAAMAELRKVAPGGASYVSESDYFNDDWRNAHWGPNYPRLLAIKQKYDPGGLFHVHHGVGSEGWSADGFTKLA